MPPSNLNNRLPLRTIFEAKKERDDIILVIAGTITDFEEYRNKNRKRILYILENADKLLFLEE